MEGELSKLWPERLWNIGLPARLARKPGFNRASQKEPRRPHSVISSWCPAALRHQPKNQYNLQKIRALSVQVRQCVGETT